MHELFGRVDLAPVPVRNKAHEILKRCIIEGKLAPGRRLSIILEAGGNQTRGNLLHLLRNRIDHYPISPSRLLAGGERRPRSLSLSWNPGVPNTAEPRGAGRERRKR
jgi:hypothetical protein